jgi:REP element-mobilizing transposase RayT
MGHTFANLLVHVIFSTKGRAPMLNPDLRARLFPYMGGIVGELQSTALIINGPSDHVHLLLAMSASRAVADVMRVLKANSSKWVHEQSPSFSDFAWQSGYGAFSVSESNAKRVKQYIANQEVHHRTVSFQEEFVAFLKRHQISYDERYIWD